MRIPQTEQGVSPYPDLPLTDRMFSVSLKSGGETLESKKEPIHREDVLKFDILLFNGCTRGISAPRS